MALLALWRMDGNGNDALWANNLSLKDGMAAAPTVAPWKVNDSMDIDGAVNYYTVSNIFWRDATATLASMFWTNPASFSGNDRFIHIINKTDNTQFRIIISSTAIGYGKEKSTSGGQPTFSFSTPTNDWTFFAFQAVNSACKLRINGTPVATGTNSGTGTNFPSEIQATSIGGGSATGVDGGIDWKMDDVRLFDNTLTDAFVKTYYAYSAGFF